MGWIVAASVAYALIAVFFLIGIRIMLGGEPSKKTWLVAIMMSVFWPATILLGIYYSW